MKSKRMLSLTELLRLSIEIEDVEVKNRIEQLYTLLYNNIDKKYITKSMKKKMEEIGFKERTLYCYKIADKIYENKAGEIDILESSDGSVLRVGIGRKLQYNPVWYELKLY